MPAKPAPSTSLTRRLMKYLLIVVTGAVFVIFSLLWGPSVNRVANPNSLNRGQQRYSPKVMFDGKGRPVRKTPKKAKSAPVIAPATWTLGDQDEYVANMTSSIAGPFAEWNVPYFRTMFRHRRDQDQRDAARRVRLGAAADDLSDTSDEVIDSVLHTFYTVDCTYHSTWQAAALEMSWFRTHERGCLTRIVSGCEAAPKQRRQRVMRSNILPHCKEDLRASTPESDRLRPSNCTYSVGTASEGFPFGRTSNRSGTSEWLSARPACFGIFYTPQYLALPHGLGDYAPFNRPNSIWYWLNHTTAPKSKQALPSKHRPVLDIKRTALVALDPDMIYFDRALVGNDASRGKTSRWSVDIQRLRGRPRAQYYGYMTMDMSKYKCARCGILPQRNGSTVGGKELNDDDEIIPEEVVAVAKGDHRPLHSADDLRQIDALHLPKEGFAVGPPWMWHVADLRSIMADWVHLVVQLRIMDKTNWIAEMVAYSLAMRRHGLSHELLFDGMVDNQDQPLAWAAPLMEHVANATEVVPSVGGRSDSTLHPWHALPLLFFKPDFVPALVHSCFTWDIGGPGHSLSMTHEQNTRQFEDVSALDTNTGMYFHFSKYRVPTDWPSGSAKFPKNFMSCRCPLLQEYNHPGLSLEVIETLRREPNPYVRRQVGITAMREGWPSVPSSVKLSFEKGEWPNFKPGEPLPADVAAKFRGGPRNEAEKMFIQWHRQAVLTHILLPVVNDAVTLLKETMGCVWETPRYDWTDDLSDGEERRRLRRQRMFKDSSNSNVTLSSHPSGLSARGMLGVCARSKSGIQLLPSSDVLLRHPAQQAAALRFHRFWKRNCLPLVPSGGELEAPLHPGAGEKETDDNMAVMQLNDARSLRTTHASFFISKASINNTAYHAVWPRRK